MAATENSINKDLIDLGNRLQEISNQMHYAVDALRVFSLVGDDLGYLPGACAMMAETMGRVSDDTDGILEKVRNLPTPAAPAAS